MRLPRALLLALALAATAGQTGAQTVSGLSQPATLDQVLPLIPVPAGSAPPMEMPAGYPGTPGTYRPGDAVQPRITRSVPCTTVAGGSCVVTWPALPSVPSVYPFAVLPPSATQPISCHPVAGTVTTTGATVKCFQPQSLLGLGLFPFTTGAAGIDVRVLAIPNS